MNLDEDLVVLVVETIVVQKVYCQWMNLDENLCSCCWKYLGRDMVDTCFHASCKMCGHMTKQSGYPNTWKAKPLVQVTFQCSSEVFIANEWT